MPRELITVQVGQCGNQVGSRFWESAIREHAAYNPAGLFNESMSSFFRNVDSRYVPPRDLPVEEGRGLIRKLKARAVVVDMEEGVVQDMLKGSLGDFFDTEQVLTSTSGSGNNWAQGHHFYGQLYSDAILECIRIQAEQSDSLQSFLLLHSLGGGTGSGLGAYILELLEDEFPGPFRFTASVFPSADDDVITSPYNALLSLAELVRHADCVLPMENQALLDICSMHDLKLHSSASNTDLLSPGHRKGAFDTMNSIAANVLLNLTSSMRFQGPLNVDLNEISMNLVPYPRMHFLLPSMSPLLGSKDVGSQLSVPRVLDQAFSDVFAREHQLIRADPRNSVYLAIALLARGPLTIAEVNRNVERLKPNLHLMHWNSDGFKLGICSTPPVGVPFSLLGLANNLSICQTFAAMRERFTKLFKRRVYLHHYTEHMEEAGIVGALDEVSSLIGEYDGLVQAQSQPTRLRRLVPLGLGFL